MSSAVLRLQQRHRLFKRIEALPVTPYGVFLRSERRRLGASLLVAATVEAQWEGMDAVVRAPYTAQAQQNQSHLKEWRCMLRGRVDKGDTMVHNEVAAAMLKKMEETTGMELVSCTPLNGQCHSIGEQRQHKEDAEVENTEIPTLTVDVSLDISKADSCNVLPSVKEIQELSANIAEFKSAMDLLMPLTCQPVHIGVPPENVLAPLDQQEHSQKERMKEGVTFTMDAPAVNTPNKSHPLITDPEEIRRLAELEIPRMTKLFEKDKQRQQKESLRQKVTHNLTEAALLSKNKIRPTESFLQTECLFNRNSKSKCVNRRSKSTCVNRKSKSKLSIVQGASKVLRSTKLSKTAVGSLSNRKSKSTSGNTKSKPKLSSVQDAAKVLRSTKRSKIAVQQSDSEQSQTTPRMLKTTPVKPQVGTVNSPVNKKQPSHLGLVEILDGALAQLSNKKGFDMSGDVEGAKAFWAKNLKRSPSRKVKQTGLD